MLVCVPMRPSIAVVLALSGAVTAGACSGSSSPSDGGGGKAAGGSAGSGAAGGSGTGGTSGASGGSAGSNAGGGSGASAGGGTGGTSAGRGGSGAAAGTGGGLGGTGGASGGLGGTAGEAGAPGGSGGDAGWAGAGNAPSDFTHCSVPSDCVLRPTSCCVCGAPELDEVAAVNADHAQEYVDAICPGGPACACPSAPNPNLLATCVEGTCRAIDVREDDASSCTSDDDCRVRATACCECGANTSPGTLIAVRSDGSYSTLVCDPGTACDECAPVYPPEATTSCESGNCAFHDSRLE